MFLKKVLSNSTRHHCYKALLNSRNYCFSRYMSFSLVLPTKYFLHQKYKFQFMSSILNFIFHQFHLKHSVASVLCEVENLCHYILSDTEKVFANEKIEDLKKIIEFLFSNGYSSKDIKEKFSDYLKSSYCSYVKISTLADIDSDVALLLPLLHLPLSVLKIAAAKALNDKHYLKDLPSRILYLAHHLELKPSQLVPLLAKHPSLLTMKFPRLDCKMKILKDANINSKYIVKDLWIFNYTEELLANRIQAALKAGVELKPWMLRCSEKFFENILLKHCETKRILGDDNLHTYLARKLDCSPEYVSYIITAKNRNLKRINIPKLEQILNFLYQRGYTPEEIRLFPRIFCSSMKTLEEKFEELKCVKHTLPTLAQLCTSNKKKV